MKYSNKQIKRILRIKEFVEIADTLSRVYNDFDNKEFIIDTFNDKERIYKMYCSSIYNLIKAIQDSKEFFGKTIKYKEFENILEQKYIANDNKYCSKDNYESTLFKIFETIRHQVNHFTKDDDDNNILFEIYIDFNIIEKLRLVINDIFYEVYNKIDKNKIKEIILSKPKIQYSFDNFSNKMDELKLKIKESDNRLNEVFKEDNNRAMELFDKLFNSSNLYDLFVKDPDAIKKFDSADIEMQESYKKIEKYINKNGTELEKETIKLIKEFMKEKESKSIKDRNKNILELQERLSELVEKHNKAD